MAPSGHVGDPDEGIVLQGNVGEESVHVGVVCSSTAPIREYNVVAINVEITLNRFLDYDPQGRMYVLEEKLARVRREEAQNRAARSGNVEPAVSLGLQGDAIQPLTIRVNQGECLRVNLTNNLANGESTSFHIHGSGLYVADTGAPAIATNPDSIVARGVTGTYEWWVATEEQEGTHYLHSHGNTREQTSHGLFGAVIVEPKGSKYLDPLGGGELRSGWAAIIQDPNGSDFREFAYFYHEIGDDKYRHRDKNGNQVPLVDPISHVYKPGGRALNYRSEPFMNRLKLQEETVGLKDKSLGYGSYTFGDPATPISRTYLGDPVKQRLVHGGSEVFHVHHVHGGSIRWRRQPGTEPTGFDRGFDKHPRLLPQASERLDSQGIFPSETYDIENECGAGGCQHSVGDFLMHCHVPDHYIGGMWMIWRVYNTRQDGVVSQDDMPSLLEIPDRAGQMEPAVTSEELIDTTADWKGRTFQIAEDNLAEWVERQLPPQGIPKGYDASVMDWLNEGNLYLNEPESEQVWPGFRSSAPGTRLPILFNPKTGKLAYPQLRPHLGKRPPFAPNHGPSPFLEPIRRGTDVPQPGENGPWSLAPAGARLKEFTVHAIALPIAMNERAGLVDPDGQLFVLKEQEDAVRANNDLRVPLTIRANAGEDVVDIVLKSELPDSEINDFFSKTDIHVHFVQFDVQASDGSVAGFNYETTIRPFAAEGETLAEGASAGDSMVLLTSTDRFSPGALVGVGMDQDQTFEIKRIKEINGNSVVFAVPLEHPHNIGEVVSNEFVRYRWYPDVQIGSVYFHDHVNAPTSWIHGLFGAIIVEPPGSTYHDPHTGEVIRSGPIADIRTNATVSADIKGSFRELALFFQDRNPITALGDDTGSSFNLRVEPFSIRNFDDDPARVFDNELHGDPETPILEAFLGDPFVIRAVASGTNESHALAVFGHWFRLEPFSTASAPRDSVHLGISERVDMYIPRAGGPQRLSGDYYYLNSRSTKIREGNFGIIRVYDGQVDVTLRKLPGHEVIPAPASSVGPVGAPMKEFDVAAIEVPLPMLNGNKGKIYVLQKDKEAVLSGAKAAEPLVLHVNVGDFIKVNLKNETEGPVSFFARMLASDPHQLEETAPPDAARTYIFYAHPEVGETFAPVASMADIVNDPRMGLFGAIIVHPVGATFTHPVTGEDLNVGWRVDVHLTSGFSYRDFSLFFQDEDQIIGTQVMPYRDRVRGVVGLNYAAEPLEERLEENGDTSKVFRSDVHGDPATPVMESFLGDSLKIHVFLPSSEQNQVFTLEGHQWPLEPDMPGADLLSSVQVGALEAITIVPEYGAGGRAGFPGDYLYGYHREPYREAGLWGIFRVHAPGVADSGLLPLGF